MSKKQALTDSKITLVESPEKLTDVACESKESKECYSKRKKEQVPSEKSVEKIKENVKEITRVHEVHKAEFQKIIKDVKSSEISTETPQVMKIRETHKAKSTKDIKDDQLDISSRISETGPVKDTKSTEDASKTKKIPVIEQIEKLYKPWNAAVPRTWAPMSAPDLNERPFVLATHLVPSLPIGLFEVLAEIIEVVTKKPVILLHESRIGRPIAQNITDIAILPAAENWKDGVLLPVSLIFKHHLNKNNSPCVYADIIVANDRATHVEDIMDLRGHRCAVADRRNQVSAAGLLFNHLHTKGENPAFFGNTLDANSQLAVLQMVAGKQAEVGILEAPVIRCHKFAVPGAEFLHILTSLGPLPPYRIMINKTSLVNNFAKELAIYLRSINQYKEWMDRLSPFGVIGFAENLMDYYNLHDTKPVITSVPYY
ncbi:uncharacterized protein [Linepithema humile]|uniref:uncharacterized protein n=1 Tax=Linepithema humile TaxID=83485 RepID=UPI000623B0EF|nr:PREDICTED: uncharacterized protein LOC105679166 [Linepithema humile]